MSSVMCRMQMVSRCGLFHVRQEQVSHKIEAQVLCNVCRWLLFLVVVVVVLMLLAVVGSLNV